MAWHPLKINKGFWVWNYYRLWIPQALNWLSISTKNTSHEYRVGLTEVRKRLRRLCTPTPKYRRPPNDRSKNQCKNPSITKFSQQIPNFWRRYCRCVTEEKMSRPTILSENATGERGILVFECAVELCGEEHLLSNFLLNHQFIELIYISW